MDGAQRFQVDLHGMVDLLSHHLYSSPGVYLRELVQNAVDAITARRVVEPEHPGRIRVVPADVAEDGCLRVHDDGIGLDSEDIATVLSSIGSTSKRDELGFQREGFLGQFGIGLLSCFLVSDRIEVRTRTADGPTWRWVGSADGTYEVTRATQELEAQGTEVRIVPRHQPELLGTESVRALLTSYAAFLPFRIELETAGGTELPGRVFPWEAEHSSPDERRAAYTSLCEDLLGFTPMDHVDLSDAASGLRGVAFVSPHAGTHRGAHRVYARHMLVSESTDAVLPEWAFFVRAVVDTERLRPTASREQLHEDDLLEETRTRLGQQLQRWLVRTSESDPARAERFLSVHALGVKAMAAQDDEMLDFVSTTLAFETSRGSQTLSALEGVERLVYADRVDDYRQLAPIAEAQGLTLVNAGYAYDPQVLARWLARHPDVDARPVSTRELLASLSPLAPSETAAFQGLVEVAAQCLRSTRFEPVIRSFRPEEAPAVLLSGRDADREADRAAVAETAEGAWLAALESLTDVAAAAGGAGGPVLVLNAANPTVRRLAESADESLQRLAVEAIYAQLLVSGRHLVRPADQVIVSRALGALIERALRR